MRIIGINMIEYGIVGIALLSLVKTSQDFCGIVFPFKITAFTLFNKLVNVTCFK